MSSQDKITSTLGKGLVLDRTIRYYGRPVPAARPRVSKFGAFYPKSYTDYKNAARQQMPEYGEPLAEPLFVHVRVVMVKPKTSKLTIPTGDVDNLAKSILDSITDCKVVWEDDKHVQELTVTKEFGHPDDEGFHVSVYRFTNDN